MKVVEIAYSGYPVSNLKRARAFYEDTLGLAVSSIFGDEETAWVEYDIGTGTLAIGNGLPEWQPSRDGCIVALEVEDFDEALSQLKRDNIAILRGPVETPVCHIVVISDPDGNTLILHKRKVS